MKTSSLLWHFMSVSWCFIRKVPLQIVFRINSMWLISYVTAEEESQELDKSLRQTGANCEGCSGVSCFNEVIPILQFICSKMDEAQAWVLVSAEDVDLFMYCILVSSEAWEVKFFTNIIDLRYVSCGCWIETESLLLIMLSLCIPLLLSWFY